MILIADSGSTKCDWALTDVKGTRLGNFETIGLNPYHRNEASIGKEVAQNSSLEGMANDIQQIFFYGAGCSSEKMCSVVQRGLATVFTKAMIYVDHDQKGSAYTVYDGEPCIACILGTGSNSCFFDGKNTREEVPSLAYILGDEASGSYFGKILLREYFYKKLPTDLRSAFEETCEPEITQVLHRVYKMPDANVYLADFMKFIVRFSSHPHIISWAVKGMLEFIDIHVKCYPEWKTVPVHFVGSVAFYFEQALQTAAKQSGIRLGRIVRKPIDGLVNYHVKYMFPEMLKA
ncbi:MAG: ATPase [Crocinitomicaceae bacterium]|nr:ATPase [Crocinitomicaceae bacterium]